jgi:hypothetical protein
MCSTHSEPGGGTEVAEEEGKDKEVEGKAEEEGEAMKWWKGDETAVMKRVEVTGMLERILVLKRENKGSRRKRGEEEDAGQNTAKSRPFPLQCFLLLRSSCAYLARF